MKLNQLTLVEATIGLRKKKFSSQELVKACLGRIKKIDGKIKSFITVCEKEAIRQAGETDDLIGKDANIFAKKSLLGIPVAVKDLFCTKGLRTTAASNVLKSYFPPYESTVTKRLLDAGAIILGKTNLDAWAHGSSTERSDFFTTHNPWDLTRIPGGSSGGSAASVVSDETITSIGTETGGSIRIPASMCGIVGLKPSYGRVSRFGVIAMASSLDCPGPLTKTVEDAALLLKIIAGKDRFDATTSSLTVEDYFSSLNNFNIKKLKIGVPKEYFIKKIEKEVLRQVWTAIRILKKKGAQIKEVSLMDPKYSVAVYTIIQRSEVSSNLARYDGVRFGNGRDCFGEEAKRRIMLGTYALSDMLKEVLNLNEPPYIQAQRVRTLIVEDFNKIFKEIDVLLAPTSPSVAIKIGQSEENPMFGELTDLLVLGSTIAGLPGINVCCGFSQGLPIGMQLIGRQFSESLLLQTADYYQKNTDWHVRRPLVGSK